jgi:NodT family efflux transporter outer membrane factor (OMF) lipoprotein
MTLFKLNPLPAAVAIAMALAGCADMSGIQSSQANSVEASALGLGGSANARALSAQWWQALGDAQLDQLMNAALVSNPNLKLAQTRLNKAQAALGLANSATLPQLTGSLDLARQQYTANGLYPPPLAGTVWNSGTLQLNAGWEMDFFGKYQAALDAAIGSAKALEADTQAASNLLASQIARTYLHWGRLHDQRKVAERSLAQREESLKLVRERFNAGLDTKLELRQSEGGLPEARQQIEALQEQMTLARHALAALAGSPALGQDLKAPSLAALRPFSSPTQLPANLLGLRPDVAAARWRVEAAGKDLVNAKAQFYPNINLVAFAGLSSIGLDRLFRSKSEQLGIAPAIRLPIFDGGRLRANLSAKTADLDAAIESYNATVIEAVHETTDQLASLQSVRRQRAEQAQAQTAAESAYDIALQRYKAGLTPYLNVLATETQVLAQRRQAIDLQLREQDTQVGLIKALGGGYNPTETVATR